MIDDKTLEMVLYLSRLEVSDQQKLNFKNQIGDILNYFDLLKNYDTSDVNPDLGTEVSEQDLRPDQIQKGFSDDDVKSFAIHFEEGHFQVPRILEDFLDNREEE
ncbi:MAG: Asp-tRNA(Asn)/Glu-tRNA(Gln) amidotransferase subunit GatC [Spirochaetales bacterium]|nr:Asp-tRNA(Asn)/Glu-tRNA(Gln) amidotransferase subunit GatC [Spirochaetales bacterium]